MKNTIKTSSKLRSANSISRKLTAVAIVALLAKAGTAFAMGGNHNETLVRDSKKRLSTKLTAAALLALLAKAGVAYAGMTLNHNETLVRDRAN